MISIKRIKIERCTNGVYLRWWFNGWHYFCFTNGYEIQMRSTPADTMVTQVFSIISKIEMPTKIKSEYFYNITVQGFTSASIDAFAGLLTAERVEQYDEESWYEVKITRSSHLLMTEGAPAYGLTFEVTRKELPNTPAVYQKNQLLYIGDTLCDLDDDEIIPQNKQVNNIAELQDRQSDFTAQFRVRKTRAMRALFQLSGEVGANTNFPYETQTAKLVQDGIEIITAGKCVLLKSDENYYYIAVYSGNIDFFKIIENLKLYDLTLFDLTWNAVNAAASQNGDLDYLFPLCEPSDDASLTPLTDDGSTVELYAGWIWPFVKVKTIWDEIFSNAGYTPEGAILTDPMFTNLWMPISSLNVNYINTAQYLYNVNAANRRVMTSSLNILDWTISATVISLFGDDLWRYYAAYYPRVAASYTFRVTITNPYGVPVHVYMYNGVTLLGELINDGYYSSAFIRRYELTIDLTPAMTLIQFYCSYNNGCTNYKVECISIVGTKIDYASSVPVKNHLPPMGQTDFVKMICNLFGLVPEATPRDKKIKFWNYNTLTGNIPNARDWSDYLSEYQDEVGYKFGDYAQNNWLRYKDSDDVIQDTGIGAIQINDENLPKDKDIVVLPVSTCDEVTILTDVDVSQINFNEYNPVDDAYKQRDNIDPRLVYVQTVPDASPAKTFTLRSAVSGGTGYDITTIKKACSVPIAFSSLSPYYSTLSQMLTKTNLRRAKFNLPVYEVAGFNHDIPIYLSQYKAYFYVNKINNYVVGRLCTIELIKL